ncbi:MAG: hypothetical protein K6U87_07155 [Firmicutes bacterium]|nr:hypothetical protein [Bacillota bacterium]
MDACCRCSEAPLQRQWRPVVILAGRQGSVLQTVFGDRRRAFYRFAVPLELPDVPRGAWTDYLAALFQRQDLERTMAVASRCLYLAIRGGAQVVDAEIAAAGIALALREVAPVLDAELSALRPAERVALG